MATGWMKSLQCRSNAFEDVHLPTPKFLNLLPNSGCTKSAKSLDDVVHCKAKKRHRHPPSAPPSRPSYGPKPRRHSGPSDSLFPVLKELPDGHSSRNVVEIIFRTSWSPEKAFRGRIELIFKVKNPAATVARFEEYRETVRVKSRSDSGLPSGNRTENSRCVADGNEVMRFHCVGASLAGSGGDAASGLCSFSIGKGAAMRTFGGSGGAHESGGGGKGRRAMLVSRVIAGRVTKATESFLYEFDSVVRQDESLVVFDSKAVLPCFLIIYSL